MYSASAGRGSHYHEYKHKRIRLERKIPSPTRQYPWLINLLYKLGYYSYHYVQYLREEPVYLDEELEELDVKLLRDTPPNIDSLVQNTKFQKDEIRHIYRRFKQGFPSSTVRLEQLQTVFGLLYPFGDASAYAQIIFESFHKKNEDFITFEEYLTSLSVLTRGSEADKLVWVFNFYDTDRDGVLSLEEIQRVVAAVVSLAGTNFSLSHVNETCERIFKELDTGGRGSIRPTDFRESFRCVQFTM